MTAEESGPLELSIEFEGKGGPKSALKISGVSADLLRDPERVRKLMDVLDLPEGTNARVRYIGTDVIVR